MILIPARLESTRFPKKMLADINGTPLIIKTAQNALKANLAPVVVACDDKQILDLCRSHKIEAVLTSKAHENGTDRCAEAARILGLKSDEIILNVQGDEPFLEKDLIKKLFDLTKKAKFIASLGKKLTNKTDILNPNIAKLVLNDKSEAIYFSRSVIPFARGSEQGIGENIEYFSHLGLYGFSNAALQEFANLKKSIFEDIEKLEQLRAIFHRKSIKIQIVQTNTIGIDTKQDLERAKTRS